jgi:hypothetical protein
MTPHEWTGIISDRDGLMIAIALGAVSAAINWYVWPKWFQSVLSWFGVVLVAATIYLRLTWRG